MTASLPPAIRFQPLVAGAPIPGGKVYFYAAGTLTPQAVYAPDGTTPLTNPLVLDANGATQFRLGTGLSYKIDLTLSDGTPVLGWPQDSITGTDGFYAAITAAIAALALGTGAAQIGYQALGGGTLRTQAEKNTDMVSVLDYGADPMGVASSNTAFAAAQLVSGNILIPDGTYLLTDFRHLSSKRFHGNGPSSIIKQGDPAKPAWYMLCDATQPTHLRDVALTGVTIQGAAASTAPGLKMEVAAGNYAIQNAEIDIRGTGCYHTLEMITDAALAIYACRIKVTQSDSLHTGCILKGVYNQYWVHIAAAANGIAYQDAGWSSVFTQSVTEGMQEITGQNAVLLGPTVESWNGTAQPQAFNFTGANPTVMGATIINVPASKAGIGISLNGGGGGPFSIHGLRIIDTGVALTTTAALVAATSATLSAPFTSSNTGVYTVIFSDASSRQVSFTSGGTAISWTGAVTASSAITCFCKHPDYPIVIPAGNTGIISAPKVDYGFKLEQYTAASVLQGVGFVGDCSTLRTTIGDPYNLVTATTYTVDSNSAIGIDSSIAFNSGATATITLPSAATFKGRTLRISTRAAFTVVSASSNVIPITGGAAGTAILAATAGKWADLVSDGTTWNIVAAN